MSIMKQLIESMIGDYLNESYKDDLVDSIYEEVSEETWEAIEEAILNELSPALLKRYYDKAKSPETHSKMVDKSNQHNKDYKKASEIVYDQLKNPTPSRHKTYANAVKDMDRIGAQSASLTDKFGKRINYTSSSIKGNLEAKDKDAANLSPAEFEKKYRMKKSEWKTQRSDLISHMKNNEKKKIPDRGSR